MKIGPVTAAERSAGIAGSSGTSGSTRSSGAAWSAGALRAGAIIVAAGSGGTVAARPTAVTPAIAPFGAVGTPFKLGVLLGGRRLLRPRGQEKLFQIKLVVRHCAHEFTSAPEPFRISRLNGSMERRGADCKRRLDSRVFQFDDKAEWPAAGGSGGLSSASYLLSGSAGKKTLNVVPSPTRVFKCNAPLEALTSRCTMLKPSPVP